MCTKIIISHLLIFFFFLQIFKFITVNAIQKIKAGVPQGSDLAPSLYNVYTSDDIPISSQTLLVTFADDTAILASNNDGDIASHNLQLHLNKIESWANNSKIKIKDDKSTQVNVSTKKKKCTPLKFNSKQITAVNKILRYHSR